MLKRELHEEILTRILENVKDGDISKLPDITADLDILRKDNVDSLKEYEEVTTKNTQLTENNEKLRSANMDLFLKLGSSKTSNSEGEKEKDKDNENVSRETLLNDIINDIGGFNNEN